jgi:hypothetical protein
MAQLAFLAFFSAFIRQLWVLLKTVVPCEGCLMVRTDSDGVTYMNGGRKIR